MALSWSHCKTAGSFGLRSGKFAGMSVVVCIIFLTAITIVFEKTSFAENKRAPYFTAAGQLGYARFVMEYGDFKTAEREFARIIEWFPESPLIPDAQFGMAEASLKAGRFKNAMNGFNLFLANFPSSALAQRAEALLNEAMKRHDEAEKTSHQIAEAPEEPARRRIRAAQVMFFKGRTIEAVDREMENLKDSGIDTVIVRVFHNPGDRFYPLSRPKARSGVYFRTNESPVVDDILAGIASSAHRNGLKVFAWMTTRYADYGVSDKDGYKCRAYDITEKRLTACKGLDLFNEDAVKRLERMFSDLSEYEIDGVLFQDDLILRHNEGFGEHAARLFKEEKGVRLEPKGLYMISGPRKKVEYTELFWHWAKWKNKRLLDVAGRLKAAVREKRPEARFALNLMYESITNPVYALAWLSQDIKTAKKAGFDYYSIMAYHRQIGAELDKDRQAVKGIIEKMAGDAEAIVGDPESVLFKFQTIDWATGASLPEAEVTGLMSGIAGLKRFSVAVVPYRPDFPFKSITGSDELAYAGTGLK